MPKPRLSIITTKADVSLDLFYGSKAAGLIEPKHIFYDSNQDGEQTPSTGFQYIYFRDPFNDSDLNIDTARKTFNKIIKKYPRAYILDGLKSFESMLFEDKWNQYELFKAVMPRTNLLKDHQTVDYSKNLVKKRISARSKGIITHQGNFPADADQKDYIVQSKLNINKEFRAYMVGGRIIEPLGIKSSKLKSQRVALITAEDNTPSEITKICDEVYDKTGFDFMGLDIAETKDDYFLLEVNRSPQFKGYNRVSGVNLAALLNSYLIKVTDKITGIVY